MSLFDVFNVVAVVLVVVLALPALAVGVAELLAWVFGRGGRP
ncbi:MAG: hypothetical protein QM708_13575 [Propioniciclava sp.]